MSVKGGRYFTVKQKANRPAQAAARTKVEAGVPQGTERKVRTRGIHAGQGQKPGQPAEGFKWKPPQAIINRGFQTLKGWGKEKKAFCMAKGPVNGADQITTKHRLRMASCWFPNRV